MSREAFVSASPDYVGGFQLVKVIGFCVLVKKPVKDTMDNILLCKNCCHFEESFPKELIPK